MITLGLSSFFVATMLIRDDPNSHMGVTKLLDQTPIPFLYLFLLGILCQRNFSSLARWTIGRAIWWAVAYYLLAGALKSQPCTVPLGVCRGQEQPCRTPACF